MDADRHIRGEDEQGGEILTERFIGKGVIDQRAVEKNIYGEGEDVEPARGEKYVETREATHARDFQRIQRGPPQQRTPAVIEEAFAIQEILRDGQILRPVG